MILPHLFYSKTPLIPSECTLPRLLVAWKFCLYFCLHDPPKTNFLLKLSMFLAVFYPITFFAQQSFPSVYLFIISHYYLYQNCLFGLKYSFLFFLFLQLAFLSTKGLLHPIPANFDLSNNAFKHLSG